MNIRNIIFDADGTLLEAENPYLYIARALEVEDEVKAWVSDYLNEKITYQELVDKETSLFISQYKKIFKRNPTTGDLEKYLPHPQIRLNTNETMEYLRKKKKNLYVLSSGFLYLIEDLVKLHIKLRHIHANRFLYDTHGDFIMIKIDVTGEKIDGFQGIIHSSHLKMSETAYIGDNAFDKKVIEYVIKNKGYVFFLQNDAKDFGLKEVPTSENFISIKNIKDLQKYV